ncbi:MULTISPECIES: hypothetical protein [unclassified Paenibacillus]|uniref:hypothetical protein n=1 Tax=unclassified Paenibacillus TaxID=185978 RepID=UPI0004178FA1|nr:MULTISPECIES: hypothetical protein [unclassified Paenibacillus]
MMEGVIGMLAWVGIILGVAFVAIGLVEGSRGEGERYNWSAVLNGSLIGGVFLLIACAYWLYTHLLQTLKSYRISRNLYAY